MHGLALCAQSLSSAERMQFAARGADLADLLGDARDVQEAQAQGERADLASLAVQRQARVGTANRVIVCLLFIVSSHRGGGRLAGGRGGEAGSANVSPEGWYVPPGL